MNQRQRYVVAVKYLGQFLFRKERSGGGVMDIFRTCIASFEVQFLPPVEAVSLESRLLCTYNEIFVPSG